MFLFVRIALVMLSLHSNRTVFKTIANAVYCTLHIYQSVCEGGASWRDGSVVKHSLLLLEESSNLQPLIYNSSFMGSNAII